ncbi:efflux RND transporter periplasmic adaptor subunit [Oscillatoria sp. FACHB-1407]|uniref:efflux RND transporter periplasmic adaptor subunit n=1 Tax=Oscillatoria sp. FACHB-1407 TaxID=2692847 RepID=UPI001687BD8A|nr:efflux RND transporter periplasmic adaptor subunit [Oscillatoria sp. FACHB-1407]MBD2465223.1 efflux RND transporter periplasmic adaptor subunit [Oscillatoria sp. FACHB-1407]
MKRPQPCSNLYSLPLLFICLGLLNSCRSGEPSAVAQQPEGIAVQLEMIETSLVSDSSNYIATLESRQSVTLQPRVEGLVSRILVNPGDTVAAGTPLIQIDPARQQAAVVSSAAGIESARADVENARATLASYQAEKLERQADLAFMQQQYNRYVALQEEGAVSQEVRDEYGNSLAIAQASLEAMNAQIEAQRAAIARAQRVLQQAQASTQEQQVQLQYYTITAPFSGTVGDIPPRVGDFVNTSTPLVTITQNESLEVNLSVPAEEAARLSLGTPIELLNDAGASVGTSRVSFIAPNTNNSTQSVLVKAIFDNASGQLRADQQVRGRVIWSQNSGVMIPTTAVTRIAGESFVYVAEPAEDNSGLVVRQQQVELGQIDGNQYHVIEGLEQGDRIAVTGLLQLSDGAAILSETTEPSNPET